MRVELERVHVHHDLPVAAAEGLRPPRRPARWPPGFARCTGRDRAASLPSRPSPFRRDEADRQARRIELQHHRAAACPAADACRFAIGEVGNRRDRRVGILPRLEIDLDEAHAGQRARLDVIDAGAEREEPFEAAGDVVLDLLRRHAREERRDDDDGNLDRRKQIHRHAREARHPDHADDEADDDDQVRMTERET